MELGVLRFPKSENRIFFFFFVCQILEIEILMALHVLRFSRFENYIFLGQILEIDILMDLHDFRFP